MEEEEIKMEKSCFLLSHFLEFEILINDSNFPNLRQSININKIK